MREPFIEIVAAHGSGQVITTIELLSPANKTPRSGHEEYVLKRNALLAGDIHLLEIDLLRAGTPTVAVNDVLLRSRRGSWNYLVCLSRAGHRSDFEIWAATVRDRLPRVLVPLTEGYPDVPLDLQSTLDRAYLEGAYDRVIDYRREPEPPLSANDTAWAESLLREQGRRP